MLVDLTVKQIINAQAGVSSLGPKRVKLVAFWAQAASAEAQNSNVESITGMFMDKRATLGKTKSNWELAAPPHQIASLLGGGFRVVPNWHLQAKLFSATIYVIWATASDKIVTNDD